MADPGEGLENMLDVVAPRKRKKPGPPSKKESRACRARDRMFSRHLKEINDAISKSSDSVDDSAKEFIKKYESTHSSTAIRGQCSAHPPYR